MTSNSEESPITDLEELENCCVLGLTIWEADTENMTVKDYPQPHITQGFAGKRLYSRISSHISNYLGWFGFEDPTFTSALSYETSKRLFHTQQAAQNYVNWHLIRTKPYES